MSCTLHRQENADSMFGTTGLEHVWQAAANVDHPDYCEAIWELAVNCEYLPGVLVFQVPQGDLKGQKWAHAVKGSQPLCRCGHRRMFVPTVERHDFCFAPEPVTLTAESPLLIGPWGSDKDLTFLRLSVVGRQLVIKSDVLPPIDWRIPAMHADPKTIHEHRILLATLVSLLRATGAVLPFMHQLNGKMPLPLCVIGSASDAVLSVGVHLDASVMRCNDQPAHVCSN